MKKEAPVWLDKPDVSSLQIGIVVARFNGTLTQSLLDQTVATLLAYGLSESQIHIRWVPGAFELPFVAQKLIFSQVKISAVICLGIVIQGDTPHFDFVCSESARGIMNVSLKTEVPIVLGVLTTLTVEQAIERVDPLRQNKGSEFARAALELATLSF